MMIDYTVSVDREMFVDDYHNGVSAAKLQKKYCLSPRQYRILLRSFNGLKRNK